MTDPWRGNTTDEIASQDDPRYETPGGAQNKVDTAFNNFKNEVELPIRSESIVERHYRSESVSSRALAQKSVERRHIGTGAIGSQELDPTLFQEFGDIAVQAEFNKRAINVQTYGATGNGTTDDYTYQQLAINSISDGHTLFYPNGTFQTNSTIVMNNKKNIKIVGDGATIRAFDLTHIIEITACNNITFENIVFNGNFKTTRGLKLINSNFITFKNCKFINFKPRASTSIGTYGLYFVGCSYITIDEDCVFENIDGTGGADPVCRGIVIESNGLIASRHVYIGKCTFKNIFPINDGDAIFLSQQDGDGITSPLDGSMYALIEKCTFIDCAKRGVKSQTRNTTVKNCVFIDENHAYEHATAITFSCGDSIAENNYIKYQKCIRPLEVYNTIDVDNVKFLYNTIHVTGVSSTTQDAVSIGYVNDSTNYTRIKIIGTVIRGVNYRYGIFVNKCNGVDIDLNDLVDNAMMSIGSINQVTYPTRDVKITRNRFNTGYLSLIASDSLVEVNTFKNNANPIFVPSGSVTNNNQILNNNFLIATYAISLQSASATNYIITGNIFGNIVTADIRISGLGHDITGNIHNKGVQNNSTGAITLITRRITRRTSPPIDGSWSLHDICYNSAPTLGGIEYWVCTTAGTPGTWTPVQLGVLSSIAATPLGLGFRAIVADEIYTSKGTTSPADWVKAS